MTHFRFPKPFSIIFFCNFFYLIFFLTNLFCRSSWMRWLIVTNIMWYIEMWNLVMWVTIIFVLFQTNHVENWFLFLFVFFFSKHNFWLFFFLSISIRVLRKDFCQFRRRIEIGWFWPGEKTFTRSKWYVLCRIETFFFFFLVFFQFFFYLWSFHFIFVFVWNVSVNVFAKIQITFKSSLIFFFK